MATGLSLCSKDGTGPCDRFPLRRVHGEVTRHPGDHLSHSGELWGRWCHWRGYKHGAHSPHRERSPALSEDGVRTPASRGAAVSAAPWPKGCGRNEERKNARVSCANLNAFVPPCLLRSSFQVFAAGCHAGCDGSDKVRDCLERGHRRGAAVCL